MCSVVALGGAFVGECTMRSFFRVRRGKVEGGGIYGALDLECFRVGDIVGGKLDGAGGKGCKKGLGEREL